MFYKIYQYEAEKRPTAETLYYDAWVSPPLSMKDKVASILGESKSTYASSQKVSNSNNEKSSSDKKPSFYRRDAQNDTKIEVRDGKEYKRIGNNFRIIRSPNSRNNKLEEDKSSNVIKANDTQQKRNTVTTNISGAGGQIPSMGILNNNIVSRNNNFSGNKGHFRCFSNDISANQIIHDNSMPNDSKQYRNDSKDPRQKSTPRVEQNAGDTGCEFENNHAQEDANGELNLLFIYCMYL